jgi:hypothetical protein
MQKTLMLAAVLLSSNALAQGMQPGEWEVTGVTTSSMFPQPQSSTARRCLSKEDAADPARLSTKDMQGCTVKPGTQGAGSHSWEFACPQQGVTGKGTVRYTATTMNSDLQMQVNAQGQKADINSKITGRYLGPCTSKK